MEKPDLNLCYKLSSKIVELCSPIRFATTFYRKGNKCNFDTNFKAQEEAKDFTWPW